MQIYQIGQNSVKGNLTGCRRGNKYTSTNAQLTGTIQGISYTCISFLITFQKSLGSKTRYTHTQIVHICKI